MVAISCQRDDDDNGGGVISIDLSSIDYDPQAYEVDLPAHFPPLPANDENPLTVDGVDLGRHLFYDPILSRDSTISCASCHRQELAFTDGLKKSIGIDGRVGERSAMSIVNMAWADNGLFWDGRVTTLEELSLHPIEDPVEMDEKLPNLVRKLQRNELYQEKFRKAFGINNTSEITPELIAKGLAQFQRTIVSGNSKIDRDLYLQIDFLTGEELDGFTMMFVEEDRVFEDAECVHCHNPGPFFTGNQYLHNGLISESEAAQNPGRYLVTNVNRDIGRFRAPTLRNIAITAPYMHDGRLETLEDVLDHYFSGGHPHPNRDPLLSMQAVTNFTQEHREAMIQALHALTDTTLLSDPRYSNPFEN